MGILFVFGVVVFVVAGKGDQDQDPSDHERMELRGLWYTEPVGT